MNHIDYFLLINIIKILSKIIYIYIYIFEIININYYSILRNEYIR